MSPRPGAQLPALCQLTDGATLWALPKITYHQRKSMCQQDTRIQHAGQQRKQEQLRVLHVMVTGICGDHVHLQMLFCLSCKCMQA